MEETFEIEIGNNKIIAYNNIRGDKLIPGDMYIGKRNTGWQLAKCLCVNPHGFVEADLENQIYSYDCHECRKVKDIIPMM